MAITNTALLDAVVLVGEDKRWGKYENRMTNWGALKAASDGADVLLPSAAVEALKKSTAQTEKVPVLQRLDTTVITAPSCSITGARAASAFSTITWAFYGFEMTIVPSVNEGNFITEAQDMANQMQHGLRKVFNQLDTLSVSQLETGKSAVFATSSYLPTSAAAYGYSGSSNNFYAYIPGVMELNDITGPFQDVSNTESLSSRALIGTYGQSNQQNAASLIGGGQFDFYNTNRIVPAPEDEIHYVFPLGSLGVYNWVDPDSRAGRVAGNKRWDLIQDPIFGFDWGVYTIEDCADTSSEMSGNVRSYTKKYQVGAWFAFKTDYSSDTSSPIIKIRANFT